MEIEKLQSLRDTLAEAKQSYWADQVEVQRRAAAAWLARAEAAIPGRAGTGRRTTGKKDSDRLRAGEPTPFRGWKTKREQKMSCGMGVERQAGERLRKPTSGAARGRGAEHYE
jgi:hypothetical protein